MGDLFLASFSNATASSTVASDMTDDQIAAALSYELGYRWPHLVELLVWYLEDRSAFDRLTLESFRRFIEYLHDDVLKYYRDFADSSEIEARRVRTVIEQFGDWREQLSEQFGGGSKFAFKGVRGDLKNPMYRRRWPEVPHEGSPRLELMEDVVLILWSLCAPRGLDAELRIARIQVLDKRGLVPG